LLNGKPLIGWAIELGLRCPSLDRMIVSTEDEEIAEVARRFGAETPFLRPKELAQDDSAELLSWQHCIRTLTESEGRAPEVLATIPATAPLRAVADVEACIQKRHDCSADLCLTVKVADRNPYFTMLTLEDSWVRMLIQPPQPIVRRQDAPEVFDIVPVCYASRPEYILSTPRLLAGKICATVVPPERSIDIDTEMDFALAEFLSQRNLSKV
jgi:N-acylneuraminate cytidylyltransferase